ncbi:hypothetical protein [uncultured Paludibaculum sp.]|uniref:hypothetical protein n=1 Tax=uncultured Paludibaculum sp. TaxID=1765020 RepID=UPI002AABEE72|nr:hypothetical protein [uncultured Paludibaculum sp.]
MDRRLRSRRIAVFSSFLLDMRRDFERLQSVGQALLVTGQHSPGLHEDLFRLRVQFLRSWWLVRAELALYSLGIGAVDTSGLVATFRGTARLFVPEMTPQASAA